jgi:hypothetical protein
MANTKTVLLGAVLAACAIFLVVDSLAQTRPSSSQEDSLKRFLRDYVGDPNSGNNITTKYFPALVDLRDDGVKEVVVYLSGGGWCGSGGCTTLILAPESSSFRVITKITVTKLPIRVLTTESNDWHDIGVKARISGTEPTCEAKLSFDGKTYPSNPTVPSAQRLAGKVSGKSVIPVAAQGTALYQ